MRFGARFEGFGASEWPLQRANGLWWNPRERRDGRGARLTRRAREEYRVYFDRSATESPAKRGDSGGMHRPSNAAWVLPQAVNSLWWNPRERRGRPVLPAGARRPADKVGEGGAPTGRRVRNSAWDGAASSAQVSRSRAMPAGGRRSKPSPRFFSLSEVRFRAPLGARCRSERPHRENWAAWVSPRAVKAGGLRPSGTAARR